MGQAKQRKVEIDALKAGTTLFDYLSSNETNERDATFTVIQLFALKEVIENFSKANVEWGLTIPKALMNDAFKDLRKDHNLEYLPTKQISDDLVLMSHVDISSFKDNIEPLIRSWSYIAHNKMRHNEKLRQHVVMMDPALVGTKDHKKGVFRAVFFELGEHKIIATNKGGVTSFTLASADSGHRIDNPLEVMQPAGSA